MSVCGWFADGDRLDCCRLHAEQLHPAPPGHQELLYFFCKVGARGVIRKFGGRTRRGLWKSCRGRSYGPSATLQRLRLGLWCGFICKIFVSRNLSDKSRICKDSAGVDFYKIFVSQDFHSETKNSAKSHERAFVLFLKIKSILSDFQKKFERLESRDP